MPPAIFHYCPMPVMFFPQTGTEDFNGECIAFHYFKKNFKGQILTLTVPLKYYKT